MFTKKFTTISIATLAALGALALNVESASARSGGGFGGHGFGGRGMMHAGFSHHGYWGHRRGYGWGYGAPLLVGTSAYALDCYYIRRRGLLYKVCE